jgi:hypothetical protein
MKTIRKQKRKAAQQIERSKLITYFWRREGDNEIKPEHVEALEERANERIAEMIGQGYTSGELNDNIRMTDDDPEDGVEYSGWWEVSTTARASRRDEPTCPSTIGQVKACPVCAPILAYAHSLPPSELPRALEIMRLTGRLYAEIHKPNAQT